VTDASRATSQCPVCGSERSRLRRSDVEDFEYFVEPSQHLVVQECVDCVSQFLHPRPGVEELVGFYPPSYHAYNENHGRVATMLVRTRARVRARQYQRLFGGPRGRLFDVGTGDCRHFDELRRFCDIECAGVELNPAVAEQGRARGYDVAVGTLETMDLTGHVGRYDLVSMNHVLEHVLEPRVAADRARQLLRPGGHLVGQLPTVTSWEARIFGRRWGGYHYPRHLQMFSREGLARSLASAGFADIHIRSAPHIQTAVSLQNTLVSRGWRPEMSYGKTPAYSALLVAVAPFELVAYACDRGGIIDFSARVA
jgi:SAM-dependent methyltransferase